MIYLHINQKAHVVPNVHQTVLEFVSVVHP